MSRAASQEQTSLTKNQSLVLGALMRADAPLSAYAILDALRDDGLRAPLQVYRALEKLTEVGVVHRLESLNAFVACHAADHDHQHTHAHIHAGVTVFAICEACGKVDEFEDAMIADRLYGWARKADFDAASTTIEVRGTCKSCAV